YVAYGVQAKWLQGRSPERREQRVGSNYAIVLRGDQSHARIHEFLLRIEHVERGSLSDPRLFSHTVEGDFGGVHLRGGCLDLRLGGVQLAPALHHRSPRLIAIDINIEALLAKCFLVLANGGIFSAALIKRDRELSQNGDVGRPKFLRYRLVTLSIGSSEPKIRIKRGLADFHRELGNVNAVHRRQYRRTLGLASGNCSRQRRWGQPIDRCAWRKPARIDPDDSAANRPRREWIRLRLA